MDDLQLRLLDPATDLDLYREAYNWRQPKAHLSAPQMPFETFAEDDPAHLTFGLFNEKLIAVYFLVEYAPARYEAHFTSRKGVSRVPILQGAHEVLRLMLSNGATEVSALVRPENKPLRRFVGQLGMNRVGLTLFTCLEEIESCNFCAVRNQRQVYVKYVKMKDTPLGPFGQNAEVNAESIRHLQPERTRYTRYYRRPSRPRTN